MKDELVSVIIPTYKRSDTLLRAINSALNQTYKNIEVLVVDDNEPNDEFSLATQEKLKTITDRRLRYIRQEKHINGAVARNVGIKMGRGTYVAFLDDDDEWVNNKIERQIEYLRAHSDIDGVSCLYQIYKGDQIIRSCKPYSGDNLHKKVIDRSVSVFTTTILLSKDALCESGCFNESLLRHQDLQLLLDFLDKHNIGVVEEYLAILHADSEINHPTVQKMIRVKNDFFAACKPHLDKYSPKERKEIMAAHYFEIVFVAVKEKKFGIAFKYLVKIGVTPKAYYDVYRRWKSRS